MKKLIFVLVIVLINPSGVLAATISLSPQARIVKPGETFSIDVIIDTKGESVIGADALFTHDKTLLEAVTVTNGTFFPDNYHLLTPGEPLVSGSLSKIGQSYTGTGVVGTIMFKALKEGVAELNFNCVVGKSSDTNITRVGNGSDIVECSALIDGQYTISNTLTPGAPTPTPNSLPNAGATGATFIAMVVGILLTIVGIIVIL